MHWKAGLTPNLLIGQLVMYGKWKNSSETIPIYTIIEAPFLFSQTTPKHIWGSYWWSSDHSPALLDESVGHTLESLKYSKYFAQLGGGWVLVQSKKISFVASGLLKVSSCASITLLRRGSLVASKTFKSSNVRYNTQGFSRRVCVALSRHTADSAVTLGRVLMLSYAG